MNRTFPLAIGVAASEATPGLMGSVIRFKLLVYFLEFVDTDIDGDFLRVSSWQVQELEGIFGWITHTSHLYAASSKVSIRLSISLAFGFTSQK